VPSDNNFSVAALALILENTEIVLKARALPEWQEKPVLPTLEGCCTIIISLGELLDDRAAAFSKEHDSFRHRMQSFRKRLGHRQADVQELRQQLICYLQYLEIFNGNLTR
jgi:hypothetical protein